jgi:hypothetical protein
MSEMVECVAKATTDARWATADGKTPAENIARPAIAAMRRRGAVMSKLAAPGKVFMEFMGPSPLDHGGCRSASRRELGVRPRVIAGAFGLLAARRLAAGRDGTVILDLESRFILRAARGRVASVYLGGRLFAVVFLLAAVPRNATRRQLEEQLWGDRPDGGPDNCKGVLGGCLYRLRRHLAPLRLFIKIEHGIGWQLCDAAPEPRRTDTPSKARLRALLEKARAA